jgi:hypothetical protein
MLPPKKTSAELRELQRVFAGLNKADKQSVLAFAQFLSQREGAQTPQPAARILQQPVDIPRPEGESVVHAIRRLAETYPMLNKDELLHEASNLMSSHVLHGNPAAAVINKLEALFADAYERYAAGQSQQDADAPAGPLVCD